MFLSKKIIFNFFHFQKKYWQYSHFTIGIYDKRLSFFLQKYPEFMCRR